jgi:hypothetical protein
MGIRLVFFLLSIELVSGSAIPDRLFLQDVSVKLVNSAELTNAVFRKLCIDKDGVTYVLTDKGVARAFDDQLALDRSFRPLTGVVVRDIALGPTGDLYYLLEDRWLSNGDNGKSLGHLPDGEYQRLAVGPEGTILLGGSNGLALATSHGLRRIDGSTSFGGAALFGLHGQLFAVSPSQIARVTEGGQLAMLAERQATSLALRGDELLIGTHQGYYAIDARNAGITRPLETKLPVLDISCICSGADGLWFGTSRGAFFQRAAPISADPGAHAARNDSVALPDGPNGIRYYASQRWLKDDQVADIGLDTDQNVWVLTRTGLSRIEFHPMSLAGKADYFDRKVRQRHIRFGFTAERRLSKAGDVTTSEMIDTDNDGGWSSYYLASQAFRFAVTGSEQARANAWDVFGALERLQTIHSLPGFPARTFERAGFKVSDPDRWRPVPGGDWEWKGHTSSDEIASQTFAYSVLWECAAKTEAERERIARNYLPIVDHIMTNNWYLLDIDGKPTLWGRWNPEYVNWYPPSIFDRRLNSAEITASLELAYKMSGQELYRQKAYELFEKQGYLTNILSKMSLLKETPGYVHLGNQMGDEWNHSDDELAFVTYWVLYRFAFDDKLRSQFGKAIHEHWDLERAEAYPMWNFIYSGCGGGANCEAQAAIWTLQCCPLDTITWRVENSHRKDLTILPENFMRREMKELLPPGERQMVRCNTQPFILDGGDGGHTEFAGDEYLLGYWLGRYLKLIE